MNTTEPTKAPTTMRIARDGDELHGMGNKECGFPSIVIMNAPKNGACVFAIEGFKGVSVEFDEDTKTTSLYFSLVGEICGSPIRSNGRRKLGSAQPVNSMCDSAASLFLFVASCLSNEFALSGKRYAVDHEL